MKIYQVLVYYFTTPFSGVLTEAYLEYGRTSKSLKYWAHSCSQSAN